MDGTFLSWPFLFVVVEEREREREGAFDWECIIIQSGEDIQFLFTLRCFVATCGSISSRMKLFLSPKSYTKVNRTIRKNKTGAKYIKQRSQLEIYGRAEGQRSTGDTVVAII